MSKRINHAMYVICFAASICLFNASVQMAFAATESTPDCDDTYWTHEKCADDKSCNVSTKECTTISSDYLKGAQCGCL